MNTIMTQRPKLHPLAEAAIRNLEQKKLTPTPAHVVWLQDAAMQMRHGIERRTAELVDWPVPCGGVALYPLTIGARQWLMTLDEDLQFNLYIQAFACAHSRDRNTLQSVTTRKAVTQAVKEWRKNIVASVTALSAVLNVVIGGPEYVEVKSVVPRKAEAQQSRSRDVDFGAFVLALCAKYPATTPEYWTFEVSMDFALQALSTRVEGEAEEGVTGRDITQGVTFRSILAHIEKELREEAANV